VEQRPVVALDEKVAAVCEAGEDLLGLVDRQLGFEGRPHRGDAATRGRHRHEQLLLPVERRGSGTPSFPSQEQPGAAAHDNGTRDQRESPEAEGQQAPNERGGYRGPNPVASRRYGSSRMARQ